MGVGYETGPQSNVEWLKQRIAGLEAKIEEGERRARLASRTDGVVTPGTAGQSLASALSLVSGASIQAGSVVSRSGGLVVIDLDIQCGTAVARYGYLFTLPPGFRPFAPGAGGDYRFGGAAYTTDWVPSAYYISNGDMTVRPLAAAVPAGGWCDVHITFRAGA